MQNSVYTINKGINRPIEFKGLRAQYIWWLAIGLVVLLVLFAALYIAGVNVYVCVGFVVIAASLLITQVYRLNGKYGEHGMMKAIARTRLPRIIKMRKISQR